MAKKRYFEVELISLAGGGQTMAEVRLEDGTVKKAFIWGGLPGEKVRFLLTKKRAGIYEGVVEEVLSPSSQRVAPRDPEAFLSTSPWQIYAWEFENQQKLELIRQAFLSQKIDLPSFELKTDGQEYNYRNKMEFAWWWIDDERGLSLAHYRRGSKTRIPTAGSSLACAEINQAAERICRVLNQLNWSSRQLKTLLLRADQAGSVVAQLYVTDETLRLRSAEFEQMAVQGFELIFSNPKSPASVITERLQAFGQMRLTDRLGELEFNYPAESFFQINLPVYQLALEEIKQYLLPQKPLVDLYSGVGTIGLSVAGDLPVRLVEINQAAVEEMRQNIVKLGRDKAEAVLAPAEEALEYITADCQLIVDPPRAGLHQKVIDKILEALPTRVIYLSCNVATQARDVAYLSSKYQIRAVTAFNFFPKTPHVENLVILDLK